MAVETIYQVTHERLAKEGIMFTDKAEAQRYDKMMDIAAAFCTLMESHLSGTDEKEVEDFAIFLAQHGDQLLKGFKGSADTLYELMPKEDAKDTATKNTKPASLRKKPVAAVVEENAA